MKPNRLVQNKDLLVLLSKSKPKMRKALVHGCSKESINSILECLLNVCNRNVNINKNDFEKLKPFNKTFKKLPDKKISLANKKNIIIQIGGFLNILIPAIGR